MCSILALAPLDLIDLFFDFQRLQVIKLGFMRLKLCIELVLAALFLEREYQSSQDVAT